jgi:hypothetical protein
MKAVGWKEMHPYQTHLLTNFIAEAVSLSSKLEDEVVLEETKANAHELIRIFGGHGLNLSAVDKKDEV